MKRTPRVIAESDNVIAVSNPSAEDRKLPGFLEARVHSILEGPVTVSRENLGACEYQMRENLDA